MTSIYEAPSSEYAETIARLHVTSWRETYTGMIPAGILENGDMADRTARWKGYLDTVGAPTYLARVDGEAAGFIRAGPVREPVAENADGHIFALYVLRRFHRQGIGRSLMALAARDWLRRGGRALSVGVLTANTGARAFYEALGARFVHDEDYEWDGYSLPESIYILERLEDLARFA